MPPMRDTAAIVLAACGASALVVALYVGRRRRRGEAQGGRAAQGVGRRGHPGLEQVHAR